MKIKLLLLLLISQNFWAQAPDIDWIRALPTPINGGYGHDILIESDGGIITGRGNGSLLTIAKLSPTGEIIWEYDVDSSHPGNNVIAVLAGADSDFFLVCLSSDEINLVNPFPTIRKLDALGNVLWTREYRSLIGTELYQAEESTDNGIMLFGSYCNVVKLDGEGTIVWQQPPTFFPSTLYSSAFKLTTDGYIVTAFNITDTFDSMSIIYKVNNAGELQWLQQIPIVNIALFYLDTDADGGILFGGDTSWIETSGTSDIHLWKLDALGNILWTQSYGGSQQETLTGIKSVTGGHVFMANSNSNNGDVGSNIGNIDIWLVKINETGEILWKKLIGGTGYDLSYTGYPITILDQMPDGSLIYMARTDSSDGDFTGIGPLIGQFVMKMTPEALANPTFSPTEFVAYPIPTNNVLHLGLKNGVLVNTVTIYNQLGQLVMTIQDAQKSGQIDVSKLQTGQYLVKVTTDQGEAVAKFIKE